MYYAIGVSAPSLHRGSTDSLIIERRKGISLSPRPHPLREKGSGDNSKDFLLVLIQQSCDIFYV